VVWSDKVDRQAHGWGSLDRDGSPVDPDTAAAVFAGLDEAVWGDRLELGAVRAKSRGAGEVVWGHRPELGPVRAKRR
jgi:hypothetical protein